MNGQQIATRPELKAQLVAGGEVAAIIPRTIEEMFRLAAALSGSGMAPASLGSPEKVMVAIMAGAELGMAPFQSLQSFAVINGKPAIWGDGLMAVVRSQGFKVKEWIDGEDDAMVARCEVTRPDNGDVAAGEFSVADARKANLWGKAGPWQQYPKRMLKMRARAFALRDGAADVLRGFQIREEVEDYAPAREVAQVRGTGMLQRLEARTPTGGFDPEHIEAELDEALDGDHLPNNFPPDGDPQPHAVEGQPQGVPEEPPTSHPAAGSLSDDDTFPGDRPSETAPTLVQRVEAFKEKCTEAQTIQHLNTIGSSRIARDLRHDLERSDPDMDAELREWFGARMAGLEDIEREARAK